MNEAPLLQMSYLKNILNDPDCFHVALRRDGQSISSFLVVDMQMSFFPKLSRSLHEVGQEEMGVERRN